MSPAQFSNIPEGKMALTERFRVNLCVCASYWLWNSIRFIVLFIWKWRNYAHHHKPALVALTSFSRWFKQFFVASALLHSGSHTHSVDGFWLMAYSALGGAWGQSRCCLYADKAETIGAEMISIHASSFFTQFRQQKPRARRHTLPSSITSKTQSLLKNPGFRSRWRWRRDTLWYEVSSELNRWGNSFRRPTDDVYIHIGVQVIKGNQAWRQKVRQTHLLWWLSPRFVVCTCTWLVIRFFL